MKAFQDYVDSIDKPDYWNYDSTGNAVVLKGTPINFISKGGRFANMRTKLYFDMKRALRDGVHVSRQVLGEHWKMIRQELDATSLNMDKETKSPILIPKEKIKLALKRSPDRADALALACVPPALAQDTLRRQRLANALYNPFELG